MGINISKIPGIRAFIEQNKLLSSSEISNLLWQNYKLVYSSSVIGSLKNKNWYKNILANKNYANPNTWEKLPTIYSEFEVDESGEFLKILNQPFPNKECQIIKTYDKKKHEFNEWSILAMNSNGLFNVKNKYTKYNNQQMSIIKKCIKLDFTAKQTSDKLIGLGILNCPIDNTYYSKIKNGLKRIDIKAHDSSDPLKWKSDYFGNKEFFPNIDIPNMKINNLNYDELKEKAKIDYELTIKAIDILENKENQKKQITDKYISEINDIDKSIEKLKEKLLT